MTLPGSATWQPWSYGDESMLSSAYDLSGYGIAAADGEIGKVDEATYDTGASYLVIKTGNWLSGHKVMLPAGVVSGIDHENKLVRVDRTQEQIRNAPEYDEAVARDSNYQQQLGDYYSESGPGWTARG
jgi:hypothetical protein